MDEMSGRRDFAAVLSRAIRDSRLSLKQLQEQLARKGVHRDIATLDYWRNGQAIPTGNRDLKGVTVLEELLDLGAGQLLSRLPSDAVSRWDPVRSAPIDRQLEEAYAVMGLPSLDSLEHIFLQDSVSISADFHRQAEVTTQLVRATRDGVHNIPIALRQIFTEDEPPRISGISGCELHDVAMLDDEGLLCAELRLPRPLRKGQLHMFSYRMDWTFARDRDSDGITRLVRPGLRYWAATIDFAGDAPGYVEYNYEVENFTRLGTPTGTEMTQRIRSAKQVQRVLRGPLPGLHSIEWKK